MRKTVLAKNERDGWRVGPDAADRLDHSQNSSPVFCLGESAGWAELSDPREGVRSPTELFWAEQIGWNGRAGRSTQVYWGYVVAYHQWNPLPESPGTPLSSRGRSPDWLHLWLIDLPLSFFSLQMSWSHYPVLFFLKYRIGSCTLAFGLEVSCRIQEFISFPSSLYLFKKNPLLKCHCDQFGMDNVQYFSNGSFSFGSG